jgi:hypothetical protein
MATLVLELEKNIEQKQIANEKLISQQWTVDEKGLVDEKYLAELHADMTTVISADHPLAIAHQKSLENYRKGKIISLSEALQRLIDEENDD